MVLQLEKCCFCIELRTGCLIIGYLNLISSLITILVLILAAAGVKVVKEALEDALLRSLSPAIAAFVICAGILFMAFAITLLVGVYLNKSVLVMAYLIFNTIYVLLEFIIFFASFFGHFNAVSIVTDIFFILLNIYFLLVIRSYYLEMDQ